MKYKTEIYWVKFNKYRLPNGDIGFSQYALGVSLYEGMNITPTKIIKSKDRITVYFSDGGKHEFGALEDVELFYRPLKKEEPKKE